MIRLHRETSSTLAAGSLVTHCDDARKGHSWRDRVSGPGRYCCKSPRWTSDAQTLSVHL